MVLPPRDAVRIQGKTTGNVPSLLLAHIRHRISDRTSYLLDRTD